MKYLVQLCCGWLLLLLVQSELNASQWFSFQPERNQLITPGETNKGDQGFAQNILDCSSWVEAPAGKHGFVKTQGDRFVFQDGQPIRFFGAQVNLWPKEQTDFAVKRMRQQGINITRQHGLNNLGSNPQSFERLDYLIAKLSEDGIYLILDLHYPLTHRFKPSDQIPGLPNGGTASYSQFINQKVASVMHERMSNIFTHLNPYTQKRYCDDPTIAMVEILNEDSLFWGKIEEPFLTELEQKFADWLRKKYGNRSGLQKAWSVNEKSPLKDNEQLEPGARISLLRNFDLNETYFRDHPEQKVKGQDQMRFFLELEEQYWAGCKDAMRKAGVKVPIEATNWQGHGLTTRVHMLGQSQLDYIDRHGYWDHPQGEGNLKWRISTALFNNLPMIKAVNASQDKLTYLGVGNLVIEKAWEQVLGLPMTISEWNTCLPNEYSLEGTGLMTAYGLLQGWDGTLQFGYFSPDWPKSLSGGSFDILGNPPQILQFPAMSTMWHRQDVKEAELVAESVYDNQTVFNLTEDRKPVPIAAALIGKVGYRFASVNRAPVVKDLGGFWDPKELVARSITGELLWDGKKGMVHIQTPRTQGVIGFLNADAHKLGQITLSSSNRFGAVYVTAMDQTRPISSARRLLVTAVGPARNTGMEYEPTEKKSQFTSPFWHLKAEGSGPVLLEAISGELEIRSDHADQFKAWVLDALGRRTRAAALDRKQGTVVLQLKDDDQTVYYELIAERGE